MPRILLIKNRLLIIYIIFLSFSLKYCVIKHFQYKHFHPGYPPSKRIRAPDINDNISAQQQAATRPCLHAAFFPEHSKTLHRPRKPGLLTPR